MGETQKIGYTIDQAVEASGIGRTKLYEYIRTGDLLTVKSGRRQIIKHRDLVALVDNLPLGRVR